VTDGDDEVRDLLKKGVRAYLLIATCLLLIAGGVLAGLLWVVKALFFGGGE
jgi:hypothetical protein